MHCFFFTFLILTLLLQVECISGILELLEKSYKKGKDISIHWYFDPDHEEMQDVAEELEKELQSPFRL